MNGERHRQTGLLSVKHTILHGRTTYLNTVLILIKSYVLFSNLDVQMKIIIFMNNKRKRKAKVASLKQHLLMACHVISAIKEPFVEGKDYSFSKHEHMVFIHMD